MSAKKVAALGRGLGALMGDAPTLEAVAAASSSAGALRSVAIAFIDPNPFQPRHRFDDDKLEELTRSIREKGVLQPVVVRPAAEDAGRFELVAGERRWRAAQAAGLHEVPVVIQDLSDGEALEVAIIENVQRQDLSAVEESRGYRRLMDEFDYTQDQVATVVGKSRSHVANLLRLLTLPKAVQQMVDEGQLSMGHARTLVGHDDALALARLIIKDDLSVRQAEAMAALARPKGPSRAKAGKAKREKDADTKSLERDLEAATGLTVDIDHQGAKGGKVTIAYKDLDQLDDLCARLLQTPE